MQPKTAINIDGLILTDGIYEDGFGRLFGFSRMEQVLISTRSAREYP
jgi:hypothetical protein